MSLLFAFGTLKQGFPLHEQGLEGRKYLGRYRTRAAYPMFIGGPWLGPMMLNEPGTGHRIEGELCDVDDSRLTVIDKLENMDQPGNFRVSIEVEPLTGGAARTALVYMKSREVAQPVHSGLLSVYDDHRFIPPDQRP